MKYIILAPAGVASGGPELAHQMCAEIKKNGYEAYMYYVYAEQDGPIDIPCESRYEKYGTTHMTSFEEANQPDNIVIVPEALTDWAFIIDKPTKVLWWMSVDNYKYISREDFDALAYVVDLHLTQSEYSADFLKKNDIPEEKIMTVSDYIGDGYTQFVYPVTMRKDIGLYNPKKGYETIKPIIENSDWLEWIPLIGLAEEQMIFYMEIAKIYVDFGNHPGKDRIPREAASCGCAVITNKRGSAAFKEDVPIPDKYKFDEPIDVASVDVRLHDIIDNFPERFHDFDSYREMIWGEKEKFSRDVKTFLEVINKDRA